MSSFFVDDTVKLQDNTLALVVATAVEDEEDEDEELLDVLPPPPGFVRVAPLNGQRYLTVSASVCSLVDRAMSMGGLASYRIAMRYLNGVCVDIVWLPAEFRQSGTVVGACLSLTLLHGAKGEILDSEYDSKLFGYVHSLEEGMLVTYNNWIGKITTLHDKIAILFPSTNGICIPKDVEKVDPQDGIHDESKFALARFYPGQAVQSATVGNLRNGMWLRGEYFEGCASEVGVCVGVKPVLAEVQWHVYNSLQNTMSNVQVEPPPAEIDTFLLTPISSCFEPMSFQIGDFVAFKDENQAKTVLGLPDSVSMDTSPYMFALRIVSTKTLVDVQWQDSTIVCQIPSIQLIPVLHPDDQDFWPTDYIILSTTDDTHNLDCKDRIGMVMSANAKERTVRVRWFTQGMDHLEGPEIEYSAYEIQMHPELQHRIGDRVILTRALSESSTNWFGEILQVQTLDGLILIRFMESGNVATVSPSNLLVFKMVEEDDSEDGDDSSGVDTDEEMTDSQKVVVIDSDMESTTSNVSWETDDDNDNIAEDGLDWDDEVMADSTEVLGNTHIGPPPSIHERKMKLCRSISMLSEEELEWVTFKSCERIPEGHRYYASGQLTYPHLFHQRIKKEYFILSKSLPQGILVRVFEDRIDLLRVLMVGPDSTPYEGGLFLFDISLPVDYPNSPPLVHFHSWTFGLGRINPNLYEAETTDGKVCLSLLGTWTTSHPSESWSPQKSNLLQLFISLQSLVLTRNPYFNEPGYEKQIGTKEGTVNSHMYNEKIYLIVLKGIEHIMKELLEGFEGEIGYHYFKMGWFRKVLERGNEIVARSLLGGGGDGVGSSSRHVGSAEELGDRDGFPIVSVSAGCLKLLKIRLEALAKFEAERMASE
ncbi:UNVERIFIED_CONTAM: hypothetical protein HDU68_000748 [Siphonaria sp. JEL0065]|nr:hypothetical protein HDU68_000748 [Siphonaria sp. JEL0065]